MFPILRVSNTVVSESFLPNFALPIQLFCHSKRESTFNQLNGLFDRFMGSNQQMKMIRHYHICVQLKLRSSIALQDSHHQLSPAFMAKERLAVSSLRRDKIGISICSYGLSFGSHYCTSGAKARTLHLKPCALHLHCTAQKTAEPRPRCDCEICVGMQSSLHPFHSSIMLRKSRNR